VQKFVLKVILVTLVLTALIGAGVFWWNNLRGSKPAFSPSREKITDVLNTTGMPLALPAGFSISVFAKDLGAPRVLVEDSEGNLLVSIPSQGKVVVLPDKNADGTADTNITLLSGLNQPHGLAFLPSDSSKLYVAETNGVSVYNYDAKNLKVSNGKKIITLPGGGGHSTRTLQFRSDEKLLISVGSTCNVCKETDEKRAKILISNADGSDLRVFAAGLRNSVFMAKNPKTNETWATEMGRDLIGDDIPPDEINVIQEGKFYGWPYCYGKKVHDVTFDKSAASKQTCETSIPSHVDIQAHSAPLGLAFIGNMWGKEYQGNLFVSYHGSWNRTVPTGYKVVRYKLDEQGNYIGVEDFITGWLQTDGTALGRPVDILIKNNNTMFISDDKAGVVYLVRK